MTSMLPETDPWAGLHDAVRSADLAIGARYVLEPCLAPRPDGHRCHSCLTCDHPGAWLSPRNAVALHIQLVWWADTVTGELSSLDPADLEGIRSLDLWQDLPAIVESQDASFLARLVERARWLAGQIEAGRPQGLARCPADEAILFFATSAAESLLYDVRREAPRLLELPARNDDADADAMRAGLLEVMWVEFLYYPGELPGRVDISYAPEDWFVPFSAERADGPAIDAPRLAV
jgi:hypothetical protein